MFFYSYISYKEIVRRDSRLMSRLNFEIQITVTPSSEWFQEENTAQECLSHYDSEYLNEFPGRKKMNCRMCSKITKCSTGKSEIFRSVRYWSLCGIYFPEHKCTT